MARLKPPVSPADHFQGDPHAAIILVEYGDFQCPHCGAAYPVVKQIEKKFGAGLALVFRHFPLQEVHPYALPAAIASEAAANQGRFWEMHALLFEYQTRLSPAILIHHAETLKLDMKKYDRDLRDSAVAQKVESQFESGIISGVNGTPSFYLNGVKYNGSYDFDSLAEAIERLS